MDEPETTIEEPTEHSDAKPEETPDPIAEKHAQMESRLDAIESRLDTVAEEVLAEILIGEEILGELDEEETTQKPVEETKPEETETKPEETIVEQEPPPAYTPPSRKRHWA